MTTLTLELTSEEAERLSSIAQKTVAEISDVLHQLISQLPESTGKMTVGAQALADWAAEGILGLWADRADSPELSRILSHKTRKKNQNDIKQHSRKKDRDSWPQKAQK